ncbi:uncharacterized protein (TIGR03084 family) [Nocardioides massiliensis]|uniref:Uncharacterized protein (TIGR03084 family) n=3 Tax=Nocardioides massiliensis TaxID=1325935 RepID=A0ABT9NLY1_9ACTN|nr:TIGR03084 family metal-binding protein [Nocardioides massiliensis]MDP9821424.1 uncharacterized protein (TIGR03084 family) [Nocardioides massiliensis]
MSALEQVLTDLVAEGDELAAHLAGLGEEQWHLDTPAEGWTVAHQVAHLAWTDHVAVLAAGAASGPEAKEAWDAVVLQAIEDPTGFVDASAAEWAQAPREELMVRWQDGRARLVETLRAHPAGEKLPWFGPPMSPTSMGSARFMETWAHARDVYDALGLLVRPTDRIRHVVHIGVRTRNFAYAVHEQEPPAEEFRVELVAPNGETWTYGPEDAEQRIVGSAYDFCLLVTQRRHRSELDLVATGEDAAHWMTIAQAFAGPPGGGRAAGATP